MFYRRYACSRLLICFAVGLVILLIMLSILIVTSVHLRYRAIRLVTSTGMIRLSPVKQCRLHECFLGIAISTTTTGQTTTTSLSPSTTPSTALGQCAVRRDPDVPRSK